MTFVNKKARVFMDRGDLKPIRRRSESRLKTYPSATDLRTWGDYVEDRRQHILELINTVPERCFGKFVPIDAIINALMFDKNTSIAELKKCLAYLWRFVDSCQLGNEDRRKLTLLKKKMHRICIDAAKYIGSQDSMEMKAEEPTSRMLRAEPSPKEDLQQEVSLRSSQSKQESETGRRRSSTSSECPAKERHLREQAEIDKLTKGTYAVKAKGPIRITTKVKGIPPGTKLPVGKITVKAQSPGKRKGIPLEEQPTEDLSTEERSRGARSDMTDLDESAPYSGKTPSAASKDGSKMSARRSVDSGRTADTRGEDDTMPATRSLGDRSADGRKKVDDDRISGTRSADSRKPTDGRKDKDVLSFSGRSVEGKPLAESSRIEDDERLSGRRSVDSARSAGSKRGDDKSSVDGVRSADSTKAAGGGKSSPRKLADIGKRKAEDSDDVSELERIIEEKESSLSQRTADSKKPADVKKSADGGRIAADSKKPADVKKSADGGKIADTTSYGKRSVHDKNADTDKDDTKLPPSERSEDEGKSSDGEKYVDYEGVGDMPDNVQKLRDQLAARDALCEEQQNSIENLRNERDKLNKRIQECLVELEALKKLNNVSDPGVPTSCKEEIEALEQEMQVMRSGNLSPEQEADLIKKEVDVLKKYCLKLKAVEEENQMLKSGRSMPSGDNEESAGARVQQLEREKEELAAKLKLLEQQAMQNKDLPENYEIYKNRSSMLDNALAERDQMQKKVDKMKQMEMQLEELKEKADRADELERTLRYYNKNDRNTDYELKRTQSRCLCLEREQQNLRSERDSMSKRIDLMNNELESLRSKAREAEMLKVERDRLQIKLNDLSHVQVHNENLMLKCKCLENAAVERDAYKMKYEEILGMECQCEMMKLQIEESRNMARERDALKKQVMDLESCIKEQEEEIKRLVAQIDNLMKNKDETQARMRDALSNMRAEVEKKDQLIAASEEKLAAVQTQLKSSIQGVSCETLCYKTRIEELERELCGARCRIGKLERQLTEKEEILRGAKRTNKSEYESVGVMKKELEAAKAENNKLQEIANKMVTLTGDEHVQKMLRQSECAVRRVVEELGKQYREWDSMRSRSRTQKRRPPGGSDCCPCKTRYEDASDMESADEKLKEELRDIQREKEKLESIVREIQAADGPQKELVNMRMENEKLQERLRSETERRRALEQKLNKILT